MRFLSPLTAILSATTLALVLTGCGDSPSVKANPKEIEAAFKDAPAEPAPAGGGAQESTTDNLTIHIGADGSVPVKALADRAAAAMRKDDLQEAMVMLQTLRRARNLNPQQLGAVQDQMAALQADIATRAASGDARAKQALLLLQQSGH